MLKMLRYFGSKEEIQAIHFVEDKWKDMQYSNQCPLIKQLFVRAITTILFKLSRYSGLLDL